MTYPDINPVFLDLGFVQVHWYGLMYVFAFLFFYWLGLKRANSVPNWTRKKVEDLTFYCALGVVLGGRLGYMLFYIPLDFLSSPLQFFALQQGGMSFHGGVLGVAAGILWFNRKHKHSFLKTADFVSPLGTLGLAFGRVGNFINGELWGKPTDGVFGFYVPHLNEVRHATQLYEAFLEGVLLFAILLWLGRKRQADGVMLGTFLFLYSVFRFLIEFVRLPDAHIGYLVGGWLTLGQVLTLPMLVLGLWLLLKARKRATIGAV